jgi:hypothetical protein
MINLLAKHFLGLPYPEHYALRRRTHSTILLAEKKGPRGLTFRVRITFLKREKQPGKGFVIIKQ